MCGMSDEPEEAAPAGGSRKTDKPLKEVVFQTVWFIYWNAKALVRLGWVPYSVILILYLGDLYFIYNILELGAAFEVGLLATKIMSLPMVVLCSIAWHRYILSSVDLVSPPHGLQWGRAEWRLLVYLFLFTAVYESAWFFATWIDDLSSSTVLWPVPYIIFGILVFLFFVRTCLVFPSAAIGTNFKFKDSYSATMGQTWTMMRFFILLYVFLSLMGWSLSLMSEGLFQLFPEAVGVILVLIILLKTLIIMIVNLAAVSLLSFMYLRLVHGDRTAVAPS